MEKEISATIILHPDNNITVHYGNRENYLPVCKEYWVIKCTKHQLINTMAMPYTAKQNMLRVMLKSKLNSRKQLEQMLIIKRVLTEEENKKISEEIENLFISGA